MSNSMSCTSSDGSFGPVVAAGCRGGFDFTLTFEQSILVVATASALAAVQLASLVLWSKDHNARPLTAIPAAVLALAATLAVCVLSYAEHTRSRRPSIVLGIFLSLTVLFDAIVVRTLWLLQPTNTTLAAVATAGLALRLVLLVLEALPKQQKGGVNNRPASKEAISGPYSIALFWWLNALFLRGFRATLTLDDLSTLEDEFASDTLSKKMQIAWEEQTKKVSLTTQTGPISPPQKKTVLPLFRALGSALAFPLIIPIPARLVFMAFNYAQPFLIMQATSYVQQPVDGEDDSRRNNGYGLIGAAALIYLGIAISRGQYNYHLYRSVTKVRGCLVGLIYQKTLTASSSPQSPVSGNKSSADGDAKAALALMGADVDRIALTVEKVYEIGACTVEAAIAIWLLERQIGWACIAPVVLGIISFAGNSVVAARTPGRLKQWMGATQARVSLTATLLRHMRSIKAQGQTAPQAFETLQAARDHELERSAHFRLLVALMNLCGALPRLLSAPLAFALFVLPFSSSFVQEGGLTAARAFTTLSLLELLTTPLGTVLQSIPQVTAAKACFDRIQDYLLREDVGSTLAAEDRSSAEASGPSTPTRDIEEKKTATAREAPVKLEIPIVQLDCVSFGYPAHKFDDAALPIIKDLSLTVNTGQLVIVVGPAGCGKTTLLKAIAGSVTPTKGRLTRRHTEMAYCQQAPWLVNTSVRSNIVGPSVGNDVDDAWYNIVREACALNDKDSQEKFPEGDEVVGSGGAALSGGQKQRVALARAVYARKPAVVLDDVLNALDAKTEHSVFSALLAPGGLLRRGDTTVIMATSSFHHLAMAEADLILLMHADGSSTQYRSYLDMGSDVVAEIERLRAIPTDNRQQIYASKSTFEKKPPSPDGKKQNPMKQNPMKQNPMKQNPMKQKPKNLADKEKEKEKEKARRSGDLRCYQTYGQSMGWTRAWIFLAIAILFAVVSKISQYWVTRFTDNVDINRGLFIGVYFLFSVVAVILSLASFWWMMIIIIPVSGSNLHKMLLTAVFHAPLSFITSTDVGVILNRFSQDMNYATAYLPISTMNTVTTVLVCIVQFAFIASGSGYLAIALPFLVGVVYLLQKFYLATSRQLRFLDLENKSPLYTSVSETVEGLPTIRAFGWARAFAADFLHRLDDSQRPVYMLYCIQRWLNLVLDLIVAALAVLLLAFATQLRSTSIGGGASAAAAAALGLAMINMLGFGQSLSQFVFFYTELETSLGAIARIREYATEIVPEDGPYDRGGDLTPVADSWPEHGDIVFDHVTASYSVSDGSDASLDVLKNVSLHIPAGKLVGLRGRTGSGKSSLTLALLGLIDLRGPGSISIDGVNLAKVRKQTIRNRITTVPQEPFFPPTHSHRKVLAGTRDESGLTDAEIMSALDAVGLLDHIKSQLREKDGSDEKSDDENKHRAILDRPMSDLPLSAGQQQQFGMASALLQQNRIIILDECTSAMDAATEARVKQLLKSPEHNFAGKTVLMVVHRASMLDVCDIVVEMDNGRVVRIEDKSGEGALN
ncbi:hypothetical protein Sste5344_003691 [Sporothrix stenoceras]